MEIIQQGNPERARKTKQFICRSCGCIFRADQNEYEYAGSQYNIAYYRHKCPTCGLWVYVED